MRTPNPSLITGSTTLFEGLVQVRRQRIMRPPNWKLSTLYKVYHLINCPSCQSLAMLTPSMNWCELWNTMAGIPLVLVHWAGWAVNRRCIDTAPGPRWQRPHTHAGLTNWATQMEEGAWWVVYRPVSGLHNGTAGFTNPTLSPTSELYKLKGTEDFSYCTKSLSRIFLFDQTSSNVLIVSAWEYWSTQTHFHTYTKPLKYIFYIHPLFFNWIFEKQNKRQITNSQRLCCRTAHSSGSLSVWKHGVPTSEPSCEAGCTSWDLASFLPLTELQMSVNGNFHVRVETLTTGTAKVGEMEWPLTCWGAVWVKC